MEMCRCEAQVRLLAAPSSIEKTQSLKRAVWVSRVDLLLIFAAEFGVEAASLTMALLLNES